MNLANTSKRVLPWFAIISFLIGAICMIVGFLKTEETRTNVFGWFNYLYIWGIRIPQLLPVITHILSVVLFFFLTFLAAALLGITKKHCFFPAVMGLFTLLFVAVMLIQEFLLYSETSAFMREAMFRGNGFPKNYMLVINICRILYCLPVCILALYMIVASFLKVEGKKFVIITVAVVLLTLVATVLLSLPLDILQTMSTIERVLIFGGHAYNINAIWSSLKSLITYVCNQNAIGKILKEALLTWIVLFFQYAGFLLYLPVALYRPKTPKTPKTEA